MKTVEGRKRITGIFRKGRAHDIVSLLYEEKGLAAHVTGGRGSGRTRGSLHGYGAWVEVDIMTVIVEGDRADEIFAYIHEKAGVGEDGGGMLTQAALAKSTIFTLPEIPVEDGTRIQKGTKKEK